MPKKKKLFSQLTIIICLAFSGLFLSLNKNSFAAEGALFPIQSLHVAQENSSSDGVLIARPKPLDKKIVDIIDLYQQMIASGSEINAIEVSGHFWTDIGTPHDYLDLHKVLLTDPSLANLIAFNGSSTKPVAVANDVVLGRDVEFKDWAFVGARARIGDGARIIRSVVWDGAVVMEGAMIEDEIVVR